MKIKPRHNSRARILWQSFFIEGKPDISLMRENIKRFKDEKRRDEESILKAVLERMRLYLSENRLRISAPVELTEEKIDMILKAEGGKGNFPGGVEFILDESLIGGIKIEKGFNIENFSIARQLELLRNSLTES